MMRRVHSGVNRMACWKGAMVQVNRHDHAEAEGEKSPDKPRRCSVAAFWSTCHPRKLYSLLAHAATHRINPAPTLRRPRAGAFGQR
jgi:hypothetical protein